MRAHQPIRCKTDGGKLYPYRKVSVRRGSSAHMAGCGLVVGLVLAGGSTVRYGRHQITRRPVPGTSMVRHKYARDDEDKVGYLVE